MTAATENRTTQMYRVFISATPEAIWDALTNPEWTQRYGYRGILDCDDLSPGSPYRFKATEEFQQMGMPEVVVDGELIEVDPPRKLVQSWRFCWDELKSEGPTRVTFEIDGAESGVSRLTVTHELENAPLTASQLAGEVEGAGGGWAFVLSDLKTLLETGSSLPD